MICILIMLGLNHQYHVPSKSIVIFVMTVVIAVVATRPMEMEVLLIRRSKHRHVSTVQENDWVLSGSVSAYHIFHASDLLWSVAWNDEKKIWMTILYYFQSYDSVCHHSWDSKNLQW